MSRPSALNSGCGVNGATGPDEPAWTGIFGVLATGLPLHLELDTEGDSYLLTIRVRDTDAEPSWFAR